MNVLLTGASGFIGSHLSAALRNAGHVVIESRRTAGDAPGTIVADYTQDLLARNWMPKLAGVDAVINAVGIIRERGEQTFERIHKLAPQALFAACVAAGVRRVVQISALGAGRSMTRYFISKRAADDYLATLPLEWTIVQPSLVYGATGASAQLFTMLASLPLVPLPGRGEQRVQPIHIDDLSDAVVRLLADNDLSRSRIALVGPEALPLRELLSQLRGALKLRPARFISIPMPLMRAGARLAEMRRHSRLDRETLSMLEAGNTADPALTHYILRRPPRPASSFIDARTRAVAFPHARLMWLLPILRIAVAMVWLWTAVASLALFPREASYELLAKVGVPRLCAPWLLTSAAALNLALGIGTLLLRKRRLLWRVQLTVIVGFTVIISIRMPELWLHPFGPIVKNLPMLAAICTLYGLDRRE